MPTKTTKPPTKTAKPTTEPRHQVIETIFVAQTSLGELRIPLIIKTKLMRTIRDSGDEIDQFFALLDGIGDTKAISLINELDIFETVEHVTTYFEAFQKKHDASVGEAKRSPN